MQLAWKPPGAVGKAYFLTPGFPPGILKQRLLKGSILKFYGRGLDFRIIFLERQH